MPFVHLHNHTHFSLLDGLAKPLDYILRAKKQGAPAVAITDHGVLYGVIEFYEKALENDMKPIIGCEIYVAKRRRFDKEANIDQKSYHLTLLAETNEGYENLIQLVTKAHLEGFYYRPRVDYELLAEYAKGLIALSGCLQGEIAAAAMSQKEERAIEIIKKYQEIFGKENFFLEMMHHPELPHQGEVNAQMLILSRETGTPLVATNDCHYANKEDSEAHDALICVQTQSKVADENRMRYEGDYSMRPPEEMKEVFSHVPEALENTLEIARRCSVELEFDKNLIPAFQTPQNEDPKTYLESLCQKGFLERYGDTPSPEAKERLRYELDMIHTMGFDTYFLIVQDFIAFAKSQDIMVGPGRGSAAGSIIAYCLGITDIEPLRYGLFFERFLNPERISMPDIDIDFADDRRDEVLEYVTKKYGADRVAQIITFGTMAARAAVRDVGRVIGIPYNEVDKIAKLIPARPGTKLEDALEEEFDLKAVYQSSDTMKHLLDLALKLEGVVRHASVHACAVVISEKPLTHYTPLQKAPGKEDNIITQYSMKPLERIGLLKMDFLGLKNLTILEKTIDIIRRTKNIHIDLKKMPLDDSRTFQFMAEGKTTGVFQFESAGMRRYLKELKPTRFEDLIAMNALYRPGPMEWIPSYIRGKHNQDKIHYLHPSFKTILEETYGVAVYQEQILQIARDFAGFSLGEADILRKAVGKKIVSLLAEQRTKFIEGALARGHSKKLAEEVFEKVIEPFAGYGFNKAHSTCYAMIAYQTAYLKTLYPAEFMTALLTSEQADSDRIAFLINECEEMGITVLPPDINESRASFTTISDTEIRFGLSAIKGLGDGTIAAILEARGKSGKFRTIDDLATRVPLKVLNKKSIESLARCGAMDSLGERNAISESFDIIVSYAKNMETSSREGQTDIFSMLSDEERQMPSLALSKVPQATLFQRLQWEKEYLGLYVSGHPLQGLSTYFAKKTNAIRTLNKKLVGHRIKIGGLITQTKKISTKSGSNMMYLTVEDPTGRIEVTVFPKAYTNVKDVLVPDTVVVMTGRLEERGGEMKFICEEAKKIALEKMVERAKEEGFFDEKERIRRAILPKKEVEEEVYMIKVPASAHIETLEKIKTLLQENKGEDPVEIHITNGRTLKRIKVPFGIRLDRELKHAIRELTKRQ